MRIRSCMNYSQGVDFAQGLLGKKPQKTGHIRWGWTGCL